MRSTKVFQIGVGAGYLFDPHRGKRRRHVLRDQALTTVRRSRRMALRKMRFAAGNLRGAFAALRRPLARTDVAVDDVTVAQRIRSGAFRAVGVPVSDVEVEVEQGVATLRGSVNSRKVADDLVAHVARVPGVRDVAAMLCGSRRAATEAETCREAESAAGSRPPANERVSVIAGSGTPDLEEPRRKSRRSRPSRRFPSEASRKSGNGSSRKGGRPTSRLQPAVG